MVVFIMYAGVALRIISRTFFQTGVQLLFCCKIVLSTVSPTGAPIPARVPQPTCENLMHQQKSQAETNVKTRLVERQQRVKLYDGGIVTEGYKGRDIDDVLRSGP